MSGTDADGVRTGERVGTTNSELLLKSPAEVHKITLFSGPLLSKILLLRSIASCWRQPNLTFSIRINGARESLERKRWCFVREYLAN